MTNNPAALKIKKPSECKKRKALNVVESKLKTRKLSFSKNVKIIDPPDVFKNYINIESINKDPNGMNVKFKLWALFISKKYSTCLPANSISNISSFPAFNLLP
ncbi:hypothetical protein EXT43_02755 [Pseudoalteromonas sp. CO109Y]|uniref:hypothetical protein n=1 Tax=Pseudoalteromonas sp. CO109Y TaxID=1777235 RepID=UPI0010238CFC|nr:hypothetical protein [Pseudoalteromonas sp. CO109Y]RZF87856.1 hypothetical protein EXT43_02755 [Pseudoalteromonas sp. CO109Y]